MSRKRAPGNPTHVVHPSPLPGVCSELQLLSRNRVISEPVQPSIPLLARLPEIFQPRNTVLCSLWMICPTDPPPPKRIGGNPPKNSMQRPSKDKHPGWISRKLFRYVVHNNYADKRRTPFFRSTRQARNTDTHALNQAGGAPKEFAFLI